MADKPKSPMVRLCVDILADRRSMEFVLGVLESAADDITDLPPEVADDVSFIINMLCEALKRR